ncbi:leucine-rich repeat domain-containing protein [Streptomyces sp. NBC_01537]|uniref:leucine-rich repeat domain-containing protein n=1 Tax=Streptomyces sp. NBC_01537 TaxID=2903896 RepID=UPI00386D656F
MGFHPERQDTAAPGWRHLLALIEEAAADGREVFKPLVELPAGKRRQIITLPPSVAKLKAVRHLVLYGSNLVRIPPEIGAMESLEEFSPYTSRRLHWFPYELTHCASLKRSTVSTRSVYGNYRLRPQFPLLQPPTPQAAEFDSRHLDPGTWGAEAIHACSICARASNRCPSHPHTTSLFPTVAAPPSPSHLRTTHEAETSRSRPGRSDQALES